MLSIKYLDGSVQNWHVGEDLTLRHNVNSIIDVIADGDELAAIVAQFDNISTTKYNRVVRWFGDMAAFIVANMEVG